ncbi:MAG: glutamyl-tRNA reductase [Actinobacteria bacterium]|jgi:glutamyl-tRNA reductase|nr:glutamyl-tRNA reductase [Actinomycetota bacterium]
MSVVVIGVNHRTSPLRVLERVAVSAEAMPKALHALSSKDNIREAVVLSTCNRTEVYAVTEKFHAAYDDIAEFFCELGGLRSDELHQHLYSQHDDAAVRHLFEVACGLDSAVIGENEILGQVRDAWSLAQESGASRTTLNLLFRHALETGKRARSETGISRSTTSISFAAVEMARELLGTLAYRKVLIIGAGTMGEGVAVALTMNSTTEVTVINRTESRGRDLAERLGAEMRPMSELRAALLDTDVVVTCIGAGSFVLDREMIEPIMSVRSGRTLFIVDIAVPRDVDESVGAIDGVELRNLDDLRDWVRSGVESREGEAAKVSTIVSEEVERYALDSTARQAAPLIAAMHAAADEVRVSEMERHAKRLAELTPEQIEAVESLARGITAKLLHEPTVRLKENAGTPQGERLADALRDLFDLH